MKYYNQISKGYNELYGQEQLEKVKIIKQYIKPKGLLLDIGAGTGICTTEFHQTCNCIALDPSEELLNQYKGNKIIGKAEQLPFKNKVFDTIISITALHHSDIKKSLQEIKRVAKPNAQIAITILNKSNIKIKNYKKKIETEKDTIYIL